MGVPTLGRLWPQYLKLRSEMDARQDLDGQRREEIERRAGQMRDRLVVNYSPLVKYVASRIGARAIGSVDHEDMISWGVLGLLDAIETFRPDRGAKFESYAISKIRWAILDELRKEDWVPRRVRLRAQEMERSREKLTQLLRRPPTKEEISTEIGIGADEYQAFLDQYSRAKVGSLEARLEADGTFGGEFHAMIQDRATPSPDTAAEQLELREHLVRAIGDLEEQEKLVATLYFYDGLTLKEIGIAMKLSEGRISQILRRALSKLRGLVSEDLVISQGLETGS